MTRIPPHPRPKVKQPKKIKIKLPTLEEEVEIAKVSYVCDWCRTEYNNFDWEGFGLSLRDWSHLNAMSLGPDEMDPWEFLDWEAHFCNAVCAGNWFLGYLAPRTGFRMDIKPSQ